MLLCKKFLKIIFVLLVQVCFLLVSGSFGKTGLGFESVSITSMRVYNPHLVWKTTEKDTLKLGMSVDHSGLSSSPSSITELGIKMTYLRTLGSLFQAKVDSQVGGSLDWSKSTTTGYSSENLTFRLLIGYEWIISDNFSVNFVLPFIKYYKRSYNYEGSSYESYNLSAFGDPMVGGATFYF